MIPFSRSAFRQFTLAMCAQQEATEPPGRIKFFREGSFAVSESIFFRIVSFYFFAQYELYELCNCTNFIDSYDAY